MASPCTLRLCTFQFLLLETFNAISIDVFCQYLWAVSTPSQHRMQYHMDWVLLEDLIELAFYILVDVCILHIYDVVNPASLVILIWYSPRVSNELGAGNPQKARLAVYAVVSLAVTEAIAVSTTLFASRHVFGYIFSDDEEVVDYVTNMAPLLCGLVMRLVV